MKRVNPFKGLGIALVTPFKEDGNVDFDQLAALVENQIEGGIDFLCVLGTTAETPCLTAEEKRAIMDCVIKVNNKRVPLLLGAAVTAPLASLKIYNIPTLMVLRVYLSLPHFITSLHKRACTNISPP